MYVIMIGMGFAMKQQTNRTESYTKQETLQINRNNDHPFSMTLATQHPKGHMAKARLKDQDGSGSYALNFTIYIYL